MLKNKVFYQNDVSDKILMVLPRVSDKVLNNLKGLPLCELITFETTPKSFIYMNFTSCCFYTQGRKEIIQIISVVCSNKPIPMVE